VSCGVVVVNLVQFAKISFRVFKHEGNANKKNYYNNYQERQQDEFNYCRKIRQRDRR
jgi:DNA repair photolyase